MKRINIEVGFEKTIGKIENCQSDEKLRMNKTAFTRKRKLTAKTLMQLILLRIYLALQLHLDDYFEGLGKPSVSKQAFSKQRKLLNPEYVREYCDITFEIAAKDDTLGTYRGMRLIAIDGSTAALENTADLKEKFGCSGSKKNAATALCSIAYDPLNHVIYDCRIDRYEKDERDLAKLHVNKLCELGLRGSLLLFDRWYPSAEFIAFLRENGFHFIMRVRRKWNAQTDAIKSQGKISIEHNCLTYEVRVLKIVLPTGEIETLLTSLTPKQLPIRKAGELYFKRWAVETAYDLIKSKLQLENFSGKTEISVKQDFYATIYLANMAEFAAGVADEQIAAADEGKNLKHRRQANRNRTIHKLRKYFLRILMEPDSALRKAMLERLISYVVEKPVSIEAGRSPDRKLPRKKRFHISRKSVV